LQYSDGSLDIKIRKKKENTEMNSFNNRTVGWITIAAGISALIGSLALIEVMVIGNSGLLSDYMTIFTSLLSIPLMSALGKMVITKNKNLGRAVQILGVLGALIVFFGGIINVTALNGVIEYENQASWMMVGQSLIGIAIITFLMLSRNNPALKKGYLWFSFVIGIAMAMSFLGLVFREELNAILQGRLSIAESSQGLKLLLFFVSPTTILGQLVWLLWTGRLFLKEKLSIEA
jgi:hypothetical protein